MTLREAFNQTFSSNVTSTHLLTHAIIPLLLKSSDPRILFVGSKTGSLAVQKDTEAMPINKVLDAGWPKGSNFSVTSYRTSKTAMHMMALEWCRVLKNDNVKIFILEPGWLATSLGKVNPAAMKAMGAKDPLVGGEYLPDIINGLHDKEVETFMSADGEIPW
jgi:NAD(P)-dependent dehydrogenase (short-subunit alcohol dehydrogenase family)